MENQRKYFFSNFCSLSKCLTLHSIKYLHISYHFLDVFLICHTLYARNCQINQCISLLEIRVPQCQLRHYSYLYQHLNFLYRSVLTPLQLKCKLKLMNRQLSYCVKNMFLKLSKQLQGILKSIYIYRVSQQERRI